MLSLCEYGVPDVSGGISKQGVRKGPLGFRGKQSPMSHWFIEPCCREEASFVCEPEDFNQHVDSCS